jgi:hypothetical protein
VTGVNGKDGPDPLGKRALYGAPSTAGPGEAPAASTVTLPVGKRALYSEARPGADSVRVAASDQRGMVTVQCQRCQQRSKGRFDHRMTCPSCRKRAWCSVTLRRD